MNKDLIIKLAKLANNNPNENEANAAARKVCVLLVEGHFKFNDIQSNTKSNTVYPNPSRYYYQEPSFHEGAWTGFQYNYEPAKSVVYTCIRCASQVQAKYTPNPAVCPYCLVKDLASNLRNT